MNAPNTGRRPNAAVVRRPLAAVFSALLQRQRDGHERQLRALGLSVETRDYPAKETPSLDRYDLVLVVPDHVAPNKSKAVVAAAEHARKPCFYASKKTSDATWDAIERWCNEHAPPPALGDVEERDENDGDEPEVIVSAPLARDVKAEVAVERAARDASEWERLAEEYEAEAGRAKADVARLQALLLRSETERDTARAQVASLRGMRYPRGSDITIHAGFPVHLSQITGHNGDSAPEGVVTSCNFLGGGRCYSGGRWSSALRAESFAARHFVPDAGIAQPESFWLSMEGELRSLALDVYQARLDQRLRCCPACHGTGAIDLAMRDLCSGAAS